MKLKYFHAASIAALLFLVTAGVAKAQSLVVLPVSVTMAAGQNAAVLTVINKGDSETSFQVRAFAWKQTNEGNPTASPDQLAATDELLVSPPLGTIAAGATQIVRLVLRRPAQEREASYRIFLDQIPPPAAPGTLRIAIRMSIPVFARPAVRVASHVQWRIEDRGGQDYLMAFNDGSRHEAVRGIALATASGGQAQVQANASPYILPGATRSWRITASGAPLAPGATLHLTAQGDSAKVDQQVSVSAGP
ncbi:MAG: fimbria/pilus periplasmic chaperone [Rhodopila sp.]|nr:fimbria/pilus periplasmic chaperone [Rhodopila sp.]